MTTRERNLAVAVSAVLGVGVVGFIGYQFVLSPLLEKNRQIAAKEVEIRRVQDDIELILIAKRKYEGQRQQSLPTDPSQGVGVAREEYGRLLEGLCRRADLTGLKIIVAEPDSKSAPTVGPKKPAYTKLTWDVTAKGDLYHLVDFLRLFYSQPLLHTVKSMTVQRPSDARSRNTRELDVSLKVEALVLDNAPVRPTLLPIIREFALLSGPAALTGYNMVAVQSGRGAPVPPPGVLADQSREYLAIAGKNVFFGPLRERKEEAPRLDEDISRFVVLTSIVGHGDGTIEACFRDQLNNYDYTINQSAKGIVSVKGEFELRGEKRLLSGYDAKKPGQTLIYGSYKAGNLRTWRVRRVTVSEVILEMADPLEDDEEKPKPAAVGFLAGGIGAVLDVPEGKMYSVGVGHCLATEPPDDENEKYHPLATKLLRREAFKAIFAPVPEASPVTSVVEDRRR